MTRKLSSRMASGQKGVALVIVLGFLVLITALIVAYFVSVSAETSVSKTYASGATGKFLADMAVNIVEGQIAIGTRGQLAGSTTRLTWASQPGMIRTYVDTPSAPNYGASTCYKLYSAQQMVISDTSNILAQLAADLPAGWQTQPAIYSDLNQPVSDSSGAWNFPIMDGNNLVQTGTTVTYQIPPTSGTIEGFSLNPSAISSNYSPLISATNNPAPMPVQWLYVLQNGAVISPDVPSVDGKTATFNNTPGPSQPGAANPIVGRIAFWTDDETCKLNINTASEGTYYGQPRTATQTDMTATGKSFGFAISPPATGEYNRYPGHPATTCLSVALGPFLDDPTHPTAPSAYTSKANDQAYLDLGGTTGTGLAGYMLLSPRNQIGGSLAGTVDESATNSPVAAISTDNQHLYDSVGEMLFSPPVPGGSSPRAPFPNPALTKTALETEKFFLTAHSRAPELTPFNTPKVSMWPQWASQRDRTAATNYLKWNGAAWVPDATKMAACGLLAFCSSFGTSTAAWSGKNEYFFQRYNAGNPLVSDTGYPSCLYTTQDWNLVPRNQSLGQYLWLMGAQPIPGYGAALTGSGSGKYGGRQFSDIVVKSLDFIRSNIDQYGYLAPTPNNALDNDENYIAPLVVSGSMPFVTGTSTAVKGFGVFPVCTNIVLGAGLPPANYTTVTTSTSGTSTNTVTVSGTVATPFLAFDFFQPAMCLPGNNPASNTVAVQNLQNLGIQMYPGGGAPPVSGTYGMLNWFSNSNSTVRPYTHVFPYTVTATSSTTAISGSSYAFQQSGTSSVTIGGNGPVTFSFLTAASDTAQQITVQFPPITLPMPTSPDSAFTYSYLLQAGYILSKPNIASARGVEINGTSAMHGDWRLAGGMAVPPPQFGTWDLYAPAPNYTSTNITQAHSTWIGCPNITQPIAINNSTVPIPTTTIAGNLVPPTLISNSNYSLAPCAPVTISGSGAAMSNGYPGDWDTGPGLMPDGPYINPVDQVSSATTALYTSGYLEQNPNATTFSPNRIVGSPVRLGSLPTGCCASPTPQPWQTLLFCPNPAGRNTPAGTAGSMPACPPYDTATLARQHVGYGNPPDHLYLEFFTMPVVQPYAISEPLSTAGLVNLNYQIAPFTYIERSTALRGVLKNTLLTGISGNDVKTTGSGSVLYKSNPGTGSYPQNWTYKYDVHYDIDRDKTIAGIDEHYFNNGFLFMYPSEICDVFLVPKVLAGNSSYSWKLGSTGDPTNLTYDQMLTWWNSTTDLSAMSLTGDNLREEPYDRLYPRLTTKSNTYTVHYRVQVLQKRPASEPAVWTEGQDKVLSEYRGSSLVERYADPNDPALDGATGWDTNTLNLNLNATNGNPDLSRLYKFRVVNTKKFAP